ncbi:hypothetical protein N7519_011332 [Penicillium mononematosum]|uniref:uncharacterized protein n=1 Tax=Penicillium mononematosum TaxID=268346 RepID=UPI0025465E9A|nr:uncharacterized protein N7519_011332 [Penicillium mononematosum]KAJ6180871.1 hypothetical protein N7519_011332 [Penicillium mononematosum]
MPSPEQADNLRLLLDATHGLPTYRLEAILHDIIKQSPEGRKIASEWLLEDKVEAKYNPIVPSSTAPGASALPSKHESISEAMAKDPMPPQIENCIYCMADFDVAQNSETSCKYHVEEDVVDEEFFKDEIAGGLDVDNKEYRIVWPDKFYYPCCGRDLMDEQCQIGWHKAADPGDRPRKRFTRKTWSEVDGAFI